MLLPISYPLGAAAGRRASKELPVPDCHEPAPRPLAGDSAARRDPDRNRGYAVPGSRGDKCSPAFGFGPRACKIETQRAPVALAGLCRGRQPQRNRQSFRNERSQCAPAAVPRPKKADGPDWRHSAGKQEGMRMKRQHCENEARILEALGQGVAAEALEEPLRTHLANCPSCTEILTLYRLFQIDSQCLCAAAPVPDAGRVWWRARLAAHRAAASQALRPIMIAERFAVAIGSGAVIALLVVTLPWLAGQIVHRKVFSDTIVYSFSLSSLIVSSAVVCLLLMAGALYALWTEK